MSLFLMFGCGDAAAPDGGVGDVVVPDAPDDALAEDVPRDAFTGPCEEAMDLTPSTPFTPIEVPPHEETSFEGFALRSNVPPDARALVVLFHGTAGSAAFVEKVETSAFLRATLDAGFGFVATESTQRGPDPADARWDVAPSSSNEDMARVTRLIDATLDSAGRNLPVFLVGMSNGAVFAGSYAEFLHEEGRPPQAIAMYEAAWPRAVFAAGAPRVPTFHVSVENEVTSDFARTREQLATVASEERAPLVDVLVEEVPLVAERFLRIPSFDEERANALFEHLVALGIVDAAGRRLLRVLTEVVDDTTALLRADPPEGVSAPELQDVREQLLVTWAMHQMRSDYARQTLAFFECHLGD